APRQLNSFPTRRSSDLARRRFGGRGGNARRSIHKTTDVSASLFLDAEIIGRRENIGNAFGLHLGNLFVHLTSDHTFQCDVTVLRSEEHTSELQSPCNLV